METEQWMVQAPLFHVILSMVLRAIRVNFTLWDHRLEVYLVLQTLLGGLSTYFLYFLTQNIFSSRRLSAIISRVYALSFPLIYLSGFVMTENIAIPLLIASAFYATRRSRTPMIISAILIGLLSYTLLFPLHFVIAATAAACLLHWLAGEDDSVVTGAICLAIAIAIRPATLPFAGPMILFVLYRHARRPNWRAATLFLFGLVLATGLVSYYNNVVFSGRVTGLGAGGGISFYLAQCEYDRMIYEYEGSWYWIV